MSHPHIPVLDRIAMMDVAGGAAVLWLSAIPGYLLDSERGEA